MHLTDIVLLGLATAASASASKTRDIKDGGALAPLLRPRVEEGTEVNPDKYIIKLKPGFSVSSTAGLAPSGVESRDFVYSMSNFQGFAGSLDAAALKALRQHPAVEYIEHDTITVVPYATQANAPWGLARISSREPGPTSYFYNEAAGSGTCSYILDTGVLETHQEFGGRAMHLADFSGEGPGDRNGHGTHVAGIVGSATYGVAKQTGLFDVKIVGATGAGSNSGFIAGMNYVAEDSATRSCPNGAVANISIGGSYSASVNAAAAALVDAGVFVGVAAGNSGTDAGNFSPASEPSVCTVAAMSEGDIVVPGSNYGSSIDVYAPGTNIKSTWNNGGTAVLSGSSMAAAHVTGMAAYLLSVQGPTDPEALCAQIAEMATQGVLAGVPAGTTAGLAFNGGG